MPDFKNDSNNVVVDQSGLNGYDGIISILNTGNNVTIYGTNGQDYWHSCDNINNRGSNVLIYASGGDDTITNYGKNSSIIGTYYTQKNKIINNYADDTKITLDGGTAAINNKGKNNTILVIGNSNNTITTQGDATEITLGSGNNKVNAYANSAIINLSHGNQTIESYAGTGTSIKGSIGTDNITVRKYGTGSGIVATVNAGAGDDTITVSNGPDVLLYANNDGSDIIYNWSSNDTLVLTSGSVSESATNGNDIIVAIGYDSLTFKDAADKTIKITNGKITPTQTSPSVSTTLTVDDSTSSPVTTPSSIITIDASTRTKAVRITGNSKANSIISGKGNDTLTGGAGNDVFIYSSGSGNDIITDYTTGQDKIKITGDKISSTSVSGSDVVLKVGGGKITIKNAKNKTLSLYNNANSITTTVIGDPTPIPTLPSGLTYTNNRKTLTVKSPFTGTIDLSKYASTVTTVNATADTKFVNIKGSSRAETLKAGKGGSVLNGGKGNDKLYGSSGADTFTYASGDGKDTIYNYASYIDTIKITSGAISKASVSGKNVVLTVGNGTITVNNAKGKDINITDSSGETKTYNFTKTVSNPTKSYIERWFLEDDNFTTSVIDSILDKKFEITTDSKYDEILSKASKFIPVSYGQKNK